MVEPAVIKRNQVKIRLRNIQIETTRKIKIGERDRLWELVFYFSKWISASMWPIKNNVFLKQSIELLNYMQKVLNKLLILRLIAKEASDFVLIIRSRHRCNAK